MCMSEPQMTLYSNYAVDVGLRKAHARVMRNWQSRSIGGTRMEQLRDRWSEGSTGVELQGRGRIRLLRPWAGWSDTRG